MPFVKKNKFFLYRNGFENAYIVKYLDKCKLRRFRNSLTFRHLQLNLTLFNLF
nr:MAG TPA: hypothetical protein [Caudoviricetes sp.]